MTKSTDVDAGETTKRAPTLKTIAFMTGYSVTAVSRALKDAPDISTETKNRVRMVAQQVGYRPSRAGLRLRTGKTQVISLILDTDEEIMGLTNQLVGGIADRLKGTEYHLVVTPYSRTEDPLGPVRYVTETGAADGIILSRMQPNDPRVTYLIENRMIFAAHGRTNMNVSHAWHDFDNEQFAFDAVQWLANKGAKRIVLLSPPDQLSFGHHMRAGFARSAASLDVESSVVPTTTTDDTIDQISENVAALMRGPKRPDGFVCGAGSSAIATVAGAESAGFKIGEDFHVVSKQSTDLLTRFRPQIHVIHENVRQAGYDLADFILRQINGEDPKDLHRLAKADQQFS